MPSTLESDIRVGQYQENDIQPSTKFSFHYWVIKILLKLSQFKILYFDLHLLARNNITSIKHFEYCPMYRKTPKRTVFEFLNYLRKYRVASRRSVCFNFVDKKVFIICFLIYSHLTWNFVVWKLRGIKVNIYMYLQFDNLQ